MGWEKEDWMREMEWKGEKRVEGKRERERMTRGGGRRDGGRFGGEFDEEERGTKDTGMDIMEQIV